MITQLISRLQDHLLLDKTVEYAINVIGNGEINAERLVETDTIDIIVNGGNASTDDIYVNLDSPIINIVKSRHALKHLSRFKNHSTVVHIVPQSYDVPASVRGVLKVTNEQMMHDGINMLLHPAAFSLLIADSICKYVSNTRIIGYTFDVDVRNKDSLNSIEYDVASFKDQRKVLKAIKHKLYANFNEPISCKQIMRDKANSNEVVIVAEITTNHGGNLDKLCKMALMAKNQGADIVKIQKRDLDSIYSLEKLESKYDSEFGSTLRAYRTGLELSIEQLTKFDAFCTENNIPWFASILDKVSFDLMCDTFEHMDLVKLPSTISNNEEYILNAISEDNDIDIVVSTGMTDKSYVDKLLAKIQHTNKMLYLVHAVSCYPTPLADLNIGIVSMYTKLADNHKNVRSGFSGHDIGSLGSILSVAAGATIVEKHIKYGSGDDLHYGSVALDVTSNEFKDFVKDIHIAKQVMGSKIKEVLAVEYHKYE
jgi:sialic acid synthase SpsE